MHMKILFGEEEKAGTISGTSLPPKKSHRKKSRGNRYRK